LQQRSQTVPWVARKVARKGKVTVYVCENAVCELPTTDPAVLSKQLAKVHKLHPKAAKPRK
jgi:uncharacterized protein YyaL (SSP411 family)